MEDGKKGDSTDSTGAQNKRDDAVKWRDPFPKPVYNESLWPRMIETVFEKELLSAEVLDIIRALSSRAKDWGRDSVKLSNGSHYTIFELSMKVIESSYKQACLVEQPHLAQKAIILLIQEIGNYQRESAKSVLSTLSQTNMEAKVRIFLYAGIGYCGQRDCHSGISQVHTFPVDVDSITKYVLKDLRLMLEGKHIIRVKHLIDSLDYHMEMNPEEFFPLSQNAEFVYLTCEFYLLEGFCDTVGDKVKEVSTSSHRGIQSCVARAHEFTGNLPEALEVYEALQQRVSIDRVKRSISGGAFWTQGTRFPIKSMESLVVGARLMHDGALTVFLHTREHGSDGTNVYKFSFFIAKTKQGKLTCTQMQLPNNGRKWANMIVVEDVPSAPLRILALPSRITKQNLQLWQYDADGTHWSEVTTRGTKPPLHLAPNFLKNCVRVDKELLLFEAVADPSLASNVFALDLVKNEWRRLPKQAGLCHGVVATAFSQDNCCTVMLRPGQSVVNEKADNELMPKYEVDVLEKTRSDLRLPNTLKLGELWWSKNIPTIDKSGYVVNPHVASVQVGNLLFVFSFGGRDRSVRKRTGNGDGARETVQPFCAQPSLEVLELTTMEWRAISLENSWVPGEWLFGFAELVYDSAVDQLHVIHAENNDVRFLCLHNVSTIKTKVVKKNHRSSKKRSLQYQIQEATTPFLVCQFCGSLEVPSVPAFLACGFCKAASYCSLECQKLDWKDHKASCKRQE